MERVVKLEMPVERGKRTHTQTPNTEQIQHGNNFNSQAQNKMLSEYQQCFKSLDDVYQVVPIKSSVLTRKLVTDRFLVLLVFSAH